MAKQGRCTGDRLLVKPNKAWRTKSGPCRLIDDQFASPECVQQRSRRSATEHSCLSVISLPMYLFSPMTARRCPVPGTPTAEQKAQSRTASPRRSPRHKAAEASKPADTSKPPQSEVRFTDPSSPLLLYGGGAQAYPRPGPSQPNRSPIPAPAQAWSKGYRAGGRSKFAGVNSIKICYFLVNVLKSV